MATPENTPDKREAGAATPTPAKHAANESNAAGSVTDPDPMAKLDQEPPETTHRRQLNAGPPPPLGSAAYVGLAGEIVRAIEPHTEASTAAVLTQLLAAFGNAVGRGPHFEAEATPHFTILSLGVVGATAAARKGSSWAQARRLIEAADPDWSRRVVTGLSSGEGLTYQVRDAEEPPEGADEETTKNLDQGAPDKRLLAVEEELSSVLTRMGRDTNTLSEVLRQAWDGKTLDALTKTNRTRSTRAHVTVIGHITAEELTRTLTATEQANGFANRFLWIYSDRARMLPFGGDLRSVDWNPYTARLRGAIESARDVGLVELDRDAAAMFADRYPELSTPPEGLLGAVTARGPAQVRRLAMIYTLIDGRTITTGEDMQAALAIWDYSTASARHIFGDSRGDPTADDIHRWLLQTPNGLTATEINDRFHGHKTTEEIGAALVTLEEDGKVRSTEEKTAGRPVTRWASTLSGKSGKSGKSPLEPVDTPLIPLIPLNPQSPTGDETAIAEIESDPPPGPNDNPPPGATVTPEAHHRQALDGLNRAMTDLPDPDIVNLDLPELVELEAAMNAAMEDDDDAAAHRAIDAWRDGHLQHIQRLADQDKIGKAA